MEHDTQEQIRALQTSLRRQRYAILVLSGIVALAGLSAATHPVGDATFDRVTCREWVVVDKDGRTRMGATTGEDGLAGMSWRDKDGKERVTIRTNASGSSGVACVDTDGKVRIHATTSASGNAGIYWQDKDGKPRIGALTFGNGSTGVEWTDKDGKPRITAGILADGTVILPTKDLMK